MFLNPVCRIVLLLCLFTCTACPQVVRLSEQKLDDTGLDCFVIQTPVATYFLEKSGGGLAKMIDKDGNDWLSFDPTPGTAAAGEFRGFPNAVHQQDGSFFHPRNSGTDSSFTTVKQVKPDTILIETKTGNGNWTALWIFNPDFCTFKMTKMPADYKYWILYEGTPGGQYNDDDWWMTSAVKTHQPLTVNHDGDIPAPEWIAFGDRSLDRALFLFNHQDDDHPDHFYQMHQQMTVFGFGRKGLEKFHSDVPHSFTIGFIEATRHKSITKTINKLLNRE
ncbi:hypothetical protein GF406_06985 [candidate division KSB1 bacterium]|nr:hypothetical protein [candidate division KSB1 bacterium]